MTIDYHTLKNWPFKDVVQSYTQRDTMLYALALGLGAEPTDEARLNFVYEKSLRALPSMAVILGYPGFWMDDPAAGIDWRRMVHGEQRIVLHRPLASAGTVVGRSSIASIVDKGAGKGALVLIRREVFDQPSGALLATVEQLNFCRGDGGYSANGQPSDMPAPPPPPMPERAPDVVCDMPTRPETALLYRLCGDANPLHVDPAVAAAAGFARPILHGLATYGVAGYAVLKSACDNDPARLGSLFARFSAPVYPGETIRTEIWRGDGEVAFRARVLERDAVVLNNGHARIGPARGAQ